MTTRKLWLVLLTILPLILFAACSRGDTPPEGSQSDLDVQVREAPKPMELSPADLLTVHFIDVGEGDAVLIIQGDYAMLVDGGSAEMGTTIFTYLRDNGIQQLEYLVATHPFADHIGGLPDVLRRMTVPFAGHTFNLGDATVTVLSPNLTDEWENRANYSIVMRVEFGSTSFLLTGDAMREVEANLLDSTVHLSSDVLKVA